MNDLLYLSTFDLLHEGFVVEYLDWFAHRHTPDLLGVGFLSVYAYLTDDLWACNLYVVPGVDVFGPDYGALAPADPFRSRVSENTANGVRGVYRPEWSLGTLDGPPVLSVVGPGVDGGALSPPGDLASDAAFLGAIGATLVDAPVATSDPPPWRTLVGWHHETPAAPGTVLRRVVPAT